MDSKPENNLEVGERSVHSQCKGTKGTLLKKRSKDEDNCRSAPAHQNSKVKLRTRRYRNANKAAAHFRLVVRLLPPNLTEGEFYNTLSPIADNEYLNQNVDERYFAAGHYSKNPFKLPTYSRAYLSFYDMHKLQDFAKKLSVVKFVDDRDTAMVPTLTTTPFVKKLFTEESKGMQKSKAKLEGTLSSDKVFQTFLKSWQLMEQDKEKYGYSELSVISSLERGLLKEKELKKRIKKQSERAIVELAGDIRKDKKSKKNNKQKKNKTDESSGEKKKKSKKKKSHPAADQNKNNIVIIEAAGRRELLRRERLKKKAERKEKQTLSTNEKGSNQVKTKTPGKEDTKKQEKKNKNAKKNKKSKLQKKDAKESKKEDKDSSEGDNNKTKQKPKIKVLRKPSNSLT